MWQILCVLKLTTTKLFYYAHLCAGASGCSPRKLLLLICNVQQAKYVFRNPVISNLLYKINYQTPALILTAIGSYSYKIRGEIMRQNCVSTVFIMWINYISTNFCFLRLHSTVSPSGDDQWYLLRRCSPFYASKTER